MAKEKVYEIVIARPAKNRYPIIVSLILVILRVINQCRLVKDQMGL